MPPVNLPSLNSYSHLKTHDPKYLEYFLDAVQKAKEDCVNLSNGERDSLKAILLTLQVSMLTGILAFYGFGKLPDSFDSKGIAYICGLLLTALFLYFVYHIFCYLHSILRINALTKNEDLFKSDKLMSNEVFNEELPIYFFSKCFKVNYNTLLVLIFSASALLTILAIMHSIYLLNLEWLAYIIVAVVILTIIIFFSTYFRKA